MKVNRVLFLVMGVALMAGFLSCQTPAGQSAGEAMDDSAIAAKVRAKLFNDPLLHGFTISVETADGVVNLRGEVDKVAEKDHATEVARSVEGVKGVVNQLETNPTQ